MYLVMDNNYFEIKMNDYKYLRMFQLLGISTLAFFSIVTVALYHHNLAKTYDDITKYIEV